MRRATLLFALLCLVLSLAPQLAFAFEGEDLAASDLEILDSNPSNSEGQVLANAAFADVGNEAGTTLPKGDPNALPGYANVSEDNGDTNTNVSSQLQEKADDNDERIDDTKNVHDTNGANAQRSITVQSNDEQHEHEWGDWELTTAPTYCTDGIETRVCIREQTHTQTRVVAAFGPSDEDLADALAEGEYGEGVGVRLLYTRPVELRYLEEADNASPYNYRTVPIDLSNPEIPENDLAVRYTGDDPYIVVVFMGTDNGWHGWTTVGATKVVNVADETRQKVAFFSWEKVLAQWNAKFNNPNSYQYQQRAAGNPDPMFDMLSIAVGENKVCQLVEAVSLSDKVHQRPAMRDPSTNMNADDLVQELGAGFNLSDMFESNWKPPTPAKDGGWSQADINLEAHWSRGTYVTKEMLADIKARGFSAVRIPVTWYQHIYEFEGDPYHIDRAWMQRVHEVVDWCLDEDLYVIINIHHEDWINRPDLDTAYDNTDLPQKFAAVWTQIANEFSGYDQRLIFEDLNEPRASGEGVSHDREWGTPWPGDVRTINNLHRDFIALMRGMPEETRHRERLIMCPLYSAGEAYPELHYIVPDDPYNMVAVSVHNYTPHAYTHYDDGAKADLSNPDQWIDCAYTNSYRDSLFRSFENIRQRYTSQGVPVVLGEFGCYYHGETRQADRQVWMTDFITYAKQLGLPCFIWGMDRTTAENVKVWNVYDQKQGVWSPLSSALLDKWFEILEDPNIVWGERALIAADEHVAIESGASLGLKLDEGATTKHLYVEEGVSDAKTFQSASMAVTQDMFDGKDVAVKFTGASPRLAICDASWKGWTYIEPYYIDWENGIAYFAEKSIDWLWSTKEGGSIGPLARLLVTTQGVGTAETGGTWVEAAALVHVHNWNAWSIATEPTCTEAGELARTCTEGDSLQTHAVKAHGHVDDGGVVTREATQTEEGVITHSCQVCGTVLATEAIPKTQPGASDDPVGPVDPVEPEDPEQPSDPGNSQEPEDPEKPGSPNEPAAHDSGDQGDADVPAIPAKPVDYEIVLNPDGVWMQGSDVGHTFSSNADYSKFVGVYVDEVLLAESNYTAVSGSTRVMLHADYLATLAVGVHTARIHSNDGDASTTFTILAPPNGSESKDIAGTEPGASSADGVALTKPAATAGGRSPNALGETASGLPKTGDAGALVMLIAVALALASGLVLRSLRSRI